jgi:hypothetical protein
VRGRAQGQRHQHLPPTGQRFADPCPHLQLLRVSRGRALDLSRSASRSARAFALKALAPRTASRITLPCHPAPQR